MRRQLNGWRRIWVALSAIWLLAVGGFAVSHMPRAADYGTSRLHESLDAVGRHLQREDPSFRYEGAWAMRNKYADLRDEELLNRLHEKFSQKVNFQRIEAKYHRGIERLPAERLKMLGGAFLVWLIPAAMLYASGSAVAWVIRGFRQSNV